MDNPCVQIWLSNTRGGVTLGTNQAARDLIPQGAMQSDYAPGLPQVLQLYIEAKIERTKHRSPRILAIAELREEIESLLGDLVIMNGCLQTDPQYDFGEYPEHRRGGYWLREKQKGEIL